MFFSVNNMQIYDIFPVADDVTVCIIHSVGTEL